MYATTIGRTVIYWVIVLACLLSVGLIAANAGRYDGLNAGVYVGACGFEYRGDPGFFCDSE